MNGTVEVSAPESQSIEMQPPLSRRDFLKLAGLAASSLAARPLESGLPPEDRASPVGIGRVTIQVIGLYPEPSFKSERIRWLQRDKLVDIIDEVQSPDGPAHNPRWYRLPGGYAHSAYIQRVETASLNSPLPNIPKGGRLGEVTVPYSQSLYKTRSSDWYHAYRLYFGSVYWITHLLDEGPDGTPWYGLTDDRLRVVLYVPAAHIRPILAKELTPISPEVPADEKRIDISTSRQEVIAYEGEVEVFRAPVSTGVPSRGPSPNGIPTDTPHGNFRVSLKTPSRHMGDGNLTSDLDAYELPGVPWVTFFHSYGIGLHGTYWHDNFGAMMSHGCVNMRNEDAKWVYRWTTPPVEHTEWYKQGWGTRIRVS
jgi:lipoprotein-anchoring transpeptidase ErfK/SrfK